MRAQELIINLNFNFFLRSITKLKPSEKQVLLIIENINLFKDSPALLLENLEQIFKSPSKLDQIAEIGLRITDIEDVDLFDFSLRLYQIKDLLLEEAKMSQVIDTDKLSKLDPLSLEYDRISVLKPYRKRVSGALLALLFFEKLDSRKVNFMSQDSCDLFLNLSDKAIEFKAKGLEPNQIFMLMFSESVNQSIISDSGSNYEDRIMSVLNKSGIRDITKTHDKNDKSTEYDFFFELGGRAYGIGAKRTLRERYKQSIKTSLTSKIDVTIMITLGLDLNEAKARTIMDHKTYIFVSDEVYQSRDFLKKIDGVYSVKDLNFHTFQSL